LDETGAPYAVCSVATDISERRRAAETIRLAREAADEANRELRATQAQLVQSAKMASLGELVAGIAHEINNPLAFALSHLSTVKRCLSLVEPALDEALDEATRTEWLRAQSRLSETENGLERIRDLVLKLRTFSRLDEGEFKLANIPECIESVLTILGHRLGDGITVERDITPPEWIECYPRLLNQALLNLISNAIEAIPGDGRVLIRTRVVGETYVLSVTDTGTGIAETHRERIFEPFFTTKPVGQGTGLGLSITYSIVRRHEGTLEVSSLPEGGTTFTLRLPLRRRTSPPTNE
jgi:two-component system NtrC family sensor kinase